MKLFKNRKKLNNKGFTLFELLAVIVILAIVMGISAQSVLRSINQSRVSSLLSTAQNAANQLNTWASEDALLTDDSGAHIGTSLSFYTTVVAKGNDGVEHFNTWYCLNDDLKINNVGKEIGILKALGLNNTDINTTGSVPTMGSATRENCSAVRYNDRLGAYEIFLSAGTQGKYYVAARGNGENFAYNRASATAEQLTD